VPEKRIPYFKPGKELKDLINLDESPDIGSESPVAETTTAGLVGAPNRSDGGTES
jgi:hypothetical protein